MNVGLRKLAEESSDVYDFIRRYQKALPSHHEGTGARELAERLAFLVDYYYGPDSGGADWVMNEPQMSAH